MKKEEIIEEFDSRFVKVYGYEFEEGKKYLWASRRGKDRLPAGMTHEEIKNLQADAVSIFVVLHIKGEPKKLLLNYEFRYPAGQFILSVPAGMIDEQDREKEHALEITAARELYEETGIMVEEGDEIQIINPGVFSTPGISDETNALVYVAINRDEMPVLSHGHTVGAEKFADFRVVDQADAEELLRTGRDDNGLFYPLYTWCALMFFVGIPD